MMKMNNVPQHDVILALTSSSVRRSYAYQLMLLELYDRAGMRARIVGGILGDGPIPTFEELVQIVDNAKLVVAVDNGILALALALRKPVIAIFGPTDENCIIWQFKKYYDMANVRVLRSELPDAHCKRPCSFQQARGWNIKGKCSKETYSDCMNELSPQQIFDFTFSFYQQLSIQP